VPVERTFHDSPGKRFYIVNGNAATGLPEPVTYECNGATMLRRSGYTMTPAQPTSFTNGTAPTIAENISSCSFEYLPNALGSQVGLLTLSLTLSKTLSGGETETVHLYHSVHISNLP
jgi:hypothetical protein